MIHSARPYACAARRVLLALAAILTPPAARAQSVVASAGGGAAVDTARYVVLTSDRPAGYYREWTSNGALHSVYEYNDRGRGPHEEAVVTLGEGGVPSAVAVVGHGYFKDTVDERYSTAMAPEGYTAEWRSSLEHGAARVAPGREFYVNGSETPTLLSMLVRAALARSRVPLLPSGEASVARVEGRELTIHPTNGAPVRVVLYELGGLGFSPQPVWMDERGARFALVSGGWTSIVPEGWERAIPAMVKAQEAARDARFARLAGDLAHRPAGGALVIRDARLFVAESATVRPHTTVVVKGNRIVAVGRDGTVATPAGARVIDAAGKTLLPGLWDMHAHISPGEDGLLHVAAGVTTIRDMGNDTVTVLALQRLYGSDSLVGPRLVLAGLIDGSGPYQVPTGVLADDSAAAVRAVDWYAAHGYEQIKVYSSMKPALVPAIVAEAHAKGLRVSGHVPAYMTAEQVVRLGFDEVQHANMLMLNFLDSVKDTRSMARFVEVGKHGAELDFASPRVRDFVALFKARGVDIDPTLVAFEGMFDARPGQLDPRQVAIADRMPPMVRRGFFGGGLPVADSATDRRYRDSYAAMMRMVKTMYDAGVPVVAGTDASPVGFALHRELELYAQAGIPPRAVLQLATIGAARIMHHADDRGSVAVGKLADLALVDGDPTANISDVRRTALVVKDGIVYDPNEIYAALGIAPLSIGSR